MTANLQKITPNLWFDNEAEEAANFYVSIFKDSKIGDITRYGESASAMSGKPVGSILTVTFYIEGVLLNESETSHFQDTPFREIVTKRPR
jgi:predicted 3-demethylubiquinone-9 3-methyltransferase (glyoxalase superfamily)